MPGRSYPFRLGSTSYVYPDELVPNARKLAGIVDDIELVLFDTLDHSNLPDDATLRRLRDVARGAGLTYTVHLPMDLDGPNPDAPDELSAALRKAIKVISDTRILNPWGYVMHLEGKRELAQGEGAHWARWRHERFVSLRKLIDICEDPRLLCVENLERYPCEELFPILDMLPLSLCLDVGHLWLDGLDPISIYHRFRSRIRIIHLHGLGRHDHASLGVMPREMVFQFLDELDRTCYDGVLTLEVFGTADFFGSRDVIGEWMGHRRQAR